MKKFLIASILIHIAGFTIAALYLDTFIKWSAGKKAGTVMVVELSPITVSKEQTPTPPQKMAPAPAKPKKIVKLQVPDKDAEEILEQEKVKQEIEPETQTELKTKEPETPTREPSISTTGSEKTTMAALSKQKEGLTQKPSELEGASNSPSDMSSIYSIILARIEKNKYYPPIAKKRGIEGTTKVTFRIKKDGSVAVVKVTKPSGAKILDDAAVDTVRKASPYPYVSNPITVPISFNLREEL